MQVVQTQTPTPPLTLEQVVSHQSGELETVLALLRSVMRVGAFGEPTGPDDLAMVRRLVSVAVERTDSVIEALGPYI